VEYEYFDNLFFSDEMSLGDAFVLNGAVHHYASLCDTLYHPSLDSSIETIQCLYKGYPNIKVIPTPEYKELLSTHPKDRHLIIPPLYYIKVRNDTENIAINWERQNYENLGIPYSLRYTNAKIPVFVGGAEDLKEELTGGEEDYVVVSRYMQEESARIDFDITQFSGGMKIVEIAPGVTGNLLQYVELLRGAKQIHVIPSSVHALVDSMRKEVTPNLFFHHIRKNYMGQVNSFLNGGCWIIVDYKEQY